MKEVAPNLDYGVTYIPAPDGSKTSWSGGWSVVIPQGVKNVEAASLPTLKRLLERKELFAPEYEFFLTLLPVSESRPPVPVGALYWDKLKDAEEAVITNCQKPEEALKTVVDTVQPQMDRFCK